MSALIASSVALTCLGDDAETFTAILRDTCGAGPLRYFPADALHVRAGYHVPGPEVPERPLRATGWLIWCVVEAVRRAGVDPHRSRVAALVGSGLRELRSVERFALGESGILPADLHFAGALRRAVPGLDPVLTIANACSAGGHALAVAQDLLDGGEADAVVVAGTDAMTESMLAMIGRFGEEPATRVRPFDRDRVGVLLGEGAAAVVLIPGGRPAGTGLARLLGTGLSCDASHETAPDPIGIQRAMTDALTRAGRRPGDIDLVFAHGTGTALNDAAEAAALREVFQSTDPGPFITAVKGAVGHTSGTSALTSLALAVHSLHRGIVPHIVGLREPLPEGAGLRFVRDRPVPATVRTVQVDAFGFGGVNAVSVLESLGGAR